jgi:DNA mismatch repair protein MSH2
VPDLSRLSKRFQKRIGTLQDAVRAYQFSHGLPAMFEFIRQRVPSKPKLQDLFNAIYLNPIQAAMTKFVGYEQLIENAIDLKATQRHEYMIKAEYKPELQGSVH